MRPTVLVVHPGALGDVAIALGPASRLPGSLLFAARGPALRLARWVSNVGGRLDLEGELGPLLLGQRADARPAELHSVEAVFVLCRDPAGAIQDRLSRVLGVPVVAGSAIPPEDGSSAHGHVARVLGVSAEPMECPWLSVPGAARHPSTVVIHPGSGGRAKRWPLRAFEEAAAVLASHGLRVRWVVGDAEIDDGLATSAVSGVLLGPSLDALAHELASAAAYLGNDSGVSHLAASLGTPSVLVFGPTAPEVWAPASRWVTAVRGDPALDPASWGLDPARIAELVLAAARG